MASTFNLEDVLTTIGTVVKVGTTEIVWAHDYSDLGADPNTLDATPLSSKVALKKDGLIDQDMWELSYYYNAADYGTIDTLKTAGTSTALSVEFEDGDKFTNTGVCVANYLTGGSVGAMQDTVAKFVLNGPWTKVSA